MDFVIKHVWLVVIFVISGLLLLWPFVRSRFGGVKEVGVMEVVTMMNRRHALILDVRENDEFAGHISNSTHIPLTNLPDKLKDLEKYKNRPVVVVCRSGNRSPSGSGILTKNGFTEVFNLRGGINAWEQANMPLEK